MPTLRDQAICVRHWDYSETSQTVSLFLRDHGMIRGLAKGSRREQGRFSGGIDLLSRGEIVAMTRPDRELATLTDWDLQEVYWGLRRSLECSRIGYYMADLVQQFFTDSSPHQTVFDALDGALRTIDSTDSMTALLKFQWLILTEGGYQPRLEAPQGEEGAPSLGFSVEAGGLVASRDADAAWRVRRGTIDALRALTGNSSPAAHDSESVGRANRLLAAYVREILHREPPTLRLIFPDL